MIYKIDNFFITDNTYECNKDTFFLKTAQNEKYLKSLNPQNIKGIITPKELIKRLGIGSLQIVGITGTNGKTTTAGAIYSILLDLGYKVAMQGTRGFFINEEKVEGKSLTTPSIFQTILHLKEAKKRECEYFIMEVSSHAIEQNRIEGIEFALKVFTNISQDHLDYHKTMQEYKRVKSSFFSDESDKLINKDGGKIDFNIKNARSYSLEYPATYKIEAYSMQNGLQAVLKHFDKFVEFSSPLVGLFNLYNITAAIASVDIITNNSLEEIVEVTNNFAGVSGRMQVVSEEPLIVVDFAHTPDGMQKVFEAVKERDISVVFGAGGDRDKSKRVLMGRVASKYAKKIYVTSDNPRNEEPLDIIKDIVHGIDNPNTLIIPDRKQAIKRAIKELDKNEILLILGKGDEEYQDIKGEKIPFSDIEVVNSVIS